MRARGDTPHLLSARATRALRRPPCRCRVWCRHAPATALLSVGEARATCETAAEDPHRVSYRHALPMGEGDVHAMRIGIGPDAA